MENNRSLLKESLKEGGVILYPTDTIWGLGCDATKDEACERILELKERKEGKSFIVLVDSVRMLEQYVPDFPEVCYDLIDLATEPLTIIYPGVQGLAKSVYAEDGSVGIRVVNHGLCQELIRALRKPIVSTSANISGAAIPTTFSEIDQRLVDGVDGVSSESHGEVQKRASKIIKIGLDSQIQIIRN
ncbi:MAG: threonylcarbamoyl-AMP synthase [Bacteroidetes bacterium]|nr:MAG: threonylcarbamoyl-AMP synthase [Bacteroidota bacterium]